MHAHMPAPVHPIDEPPVPVQVPEEWRQHQRKTSRTHGPQAQCVHTLPLLVRNDVQSSVQLSSYSAPASALLVALSRLEMPEISQIRATPADRC